LAVSDAYLGLQARVPPLRAFATEVAPFGGIKESDLGREGSRHGIEEFLDMKTYHIAG